MLFRSAHSRMLLGIIKSAMLIRMSRKIAGYTLIEIMITLIIATTLISMGVFTLTSYMPKQRLLDALETTEQSLSRAQLEATSRSVWACILSLPLLLARPHLWKFAWTAIATVLVKQPTNQLSNLDPIFPLLPVQALDPQVLKTLLIFHPALFGSIPLGVPRNCVLTTCTPTSFQLVYVTVICPQAIWPVKLRRFPAV